MDYSPIFSATRACVCAICILCVCCSTPATSIAADYIIGEGDVLRISVYGHEDLTTIERVSGAGMINFPLLGQVSVVGLTTSEVSRKLSVLLEDGYLVSPQVAVFIQEFRSQKAVIMGEVVRPGLYELKGNTSFLELVSTAGGLTHEAGTTAIIKRKGASAGTHEEILTIDLSRLIERGDTTVDVPVLDGDSIYIAKAGLIYVTGEVKRPDAYKYEKDTSVIKAITMAGGFTDKAAASKVKIIRKTETGDETVLKEVSMDQIVMSGDVIVVPESFF